MDALEKLILQLLQLLPTQYVLQQLEVKRGGQKKFSVRPLVKKAGKFLKSKLTEAESRGGNLDFRIKINPRRTRELIIA